MKKNLKYLFFLLLIIIFHYQESSFIYAQGEGYSQYRLFHQEKVDDYFVSISISPKNPVVGQQIFSINVLDNSTKEPIEELKIDVFATPLFDDNKKKAPALSSAGMKGYYQAILRLEKQGNWVMDFEIDNGSSVLVVSEQIEIFERNRTLNSSSFSYGFIVMQLIFVFGILFVFLRARKKRKEISNL